MRSIIAMQLKYFSQTFCQNYFSELCELGLSQLIYLNFSRYMRDKSPVVIGSSLFLLMIS